MREKGTGFTLSARRFVITLVGALLLALGFSVEAQQEKKVPRVGILLPWSSASDVSLCLFSKLSARGCTRRVTWRVRTWQSRIVMLRG